MIFGFIQCKYILKCKDRKFSSMISQTAIFKLQRNFFGYFFFIVQLHLLRSKMYVWIIHDFCSLNIYACNDEFLMIWSSLIVLFAFQIFELWSKENWASQKLSRIFFLNDWEATWILSIISHGQKQVVSFLNLSIPFLFSVVFIPFLARNFKLRCIWDLIRFKNSSENKFNPSHKTGFSCSWISRISC